MSVMDFTGRLVRLRTLGRNLTFGVLAAQGRQVLCVFDQAVRIRVESILRVAGDLRPSTTSAEFDSELVVASFEVVALDEGPPSTQIQDMRYSRDVLQFPHLYMRRADIHQQVEGRWRAIMKLRDSFASKGLIEVQSPKIVGRLADGATQKFSVDFSGQKAFLSLSNLLYHTAYIAADFSSIFEISPLYRADENRSSKHISEFLILEATLAYAGQDELIDLANDAVRVICESVGQRSPTNDWDDIPVVSYSEVCQFSSRVVDQPMRLGDKIKRVHAQAMSDHLGSTLFWVVDMPAPHKAFFSSTRFDASLGIEVANDFRLFWREIDVVDGGERITDARELRRRLAELGRDAQNFAYYTEVV